MHTVLLQLTEDSDPASLLEALGVMEAAIRRDSRHRIPDPWRSETMRVSVLQEAESSRLVGAEADTKISSCDRLLRVQRMCVAWITVLVRVSGLSRRSYDTDRSSFIDILRYATKAVKGSIIPSRTFKKG